VLCVQRRKTTVPVDNLKQPQDPCLGGVLLRAGAVMFFMPMWIATGATVLMSAVPWIRWSNRFSLRTLLIVTMLVAVVLGLAVWAAR
jgi:hypothetical protein